MKERPILFNGPMVRALLDGRKTQTRRIAKLDTNYQTAPVAMDNETPNYWAFGWDHYCCPYGEIGDRLWVKERLQSGIICEKPCVSYALDDVFLFDPDEDRYLGWPWKRPTLPSIHMPRWAARITLEITNVRLQRLQDITEEDAIAEGIERNADPDHPEKWDEGDGWLPFDHPANIDGPPVFYPVREWYRPLWNSLNEKRGFGWDTNPWVWSITFQRIP